MILETIGNLDIFRPRVKLVSTKTILRNMVCYTVLRICSTPLFSIFSLSGFEREPFKLHKQMIPHFVALDVGSKISQAQLCSSIRGSHATFLLKNTLFKVEVAWQPLIEGKGCSPSMLRHVLGHSNEVLFVFLPSFLVKI